MGTSNESVKVVGAKGDRRAGEAFFGSAEVAGGCRSAVKLTSNMPFKDAEIVPL
jgi:hypothetical protein